MKVLPLVRQTVSFYHTPIGNATVSLFLLPWGKFAYQQEKNGLFAEIYDSFTGKPLPKSWFCGKVNRMNPLRILEMPMVLEASFVWETGCER